MSIQEIRVLIVEDSQDLAELWRILLTRAGISSTYCSNGADAIAALKSGLCPDILMTDFHLPDMTGSELVAAAQELKCRNFLIVSGNIYAAKNAKFPEGTRFLTKPVEKTDLIEKIKAFVPEQH